MKNRLITLVVILLMFCPVNAFAGTEAEKDRGTISAKGHAEDSFKPDTVEIIIAVENQDRRASVAAASNSKITGDVIRGLKQFIRDEKKNWIKTASFNVQPVYEYSKKIGKNVLTGYRVINQLEVKTDRISDAGLIIDTALGRGANRIDSVQFGISNNREHCNELLSKAAIRAREYAEAVAKALDVQIAGIKNATISCQAETRRPPVRFSMMQEARASKGTTPIKAGSIRLSASVSTVLYINQ